MDFYILRNKATGWQGSVSEKIYYDRIKKAEYEDPGGLEAPAVAPKATWEIKDLGRGWFDVVMGDQKANEKSMRKAAAIELMNTLNAGS